METQNYINHIGIVIDESSSMDRHRDQVIDVIDTQVNYLATRSKELDQETRVTTYLFSDRVRCIHYDKDVLRLPSLKNKYSPNGMTALVDATIQAIDDMEKTAQLYGDHAFLIYVVTDGQENASRRSQKEMIRRLGMECLPENWTIAVLVPDQRSVFEAKKFGFPAANIGVWDATSNKGFMEVGTTIQKATDRWMENRHKGIRGSKTLFQLDVSKLDNAQVVNNLKKLKYNDVHILNVGYEGNEIRPFVEKHIKYYVTGSAYYQITKTETIQANKKLCLVNKITREVFVGPEVRQLLGLPNESARVKAADHPKYDIYVQSTSVNRKLVVGTKLLVMRNA